MSLMSGRRAGAPAIGPYELLELIGEGGMADVYLGIKKNVSNIRAFYALKVVKAAHARNERFGRMLLDEARVMATIRHPNLVTLHDILEHDGQYVIVMELLKGIDGRRLLGKLGQERDALPAEIALNIIHQACVGLHHAHDARSIEGERLNLVHRDISPHNLFISFDGYVKVLDFGIAKSEIQEEESKSGMLRGKIPYLAPEQCADGVGVDRRTDVYALGVVLYELLTARRPFEARNDLQLIHAILYNTPEPVAWHMPTLPEGLSHAVMRALSKKPDERYESCEAMRDALSQLADTLGWSLSERVVARYMEQEYSEHREAFDARLVRLLTSTAERAEHQISIEFDDSSVQRVPLGPDCMAIVRQRNGFVGQKLMGQLRESSRLSALLDYEAPRELVLDLAGITRITSFGIRQWLLILPQLRARCAQLVLSRVSPVVVNQLVTIPAMAEGVEVASLMVPFRCATCSHSFTRITRAGEAIAMSTPCTRCDDGDARFDEDDIYLSPLAHVPRIDPTLRRFIDELEALDEVEARPPVEKHITAERTEVYLQGDIPRNTRWDRLLAGVEGALRVDIAPGAALDEETWRRFEIALSQLDEELAVSVWGFPAKDAEAFVPLHQRAPYIKSFGLGSACPLCQHTEHREWRLRGDVLRSACRKCAEVLTLPLAASPALALPIVPDGAPEPPLASAPAPPPHVTLMTAPAHAPQMVSSPSSAMSWVLTAVIAALVCSIAWVLLT